MQNTQASYTIFFFHNIEKLEVFKTNFHSCQTFGTFFQNFSDLTKRNFFLTFWRFFTTFWSRKKVGGRRVYQGILWWGVGREHTLNTRISQINSDPLGKGDFLAKVGGTKIPPQKIARKSLEEQKRNKKTKKKKLCALKACKIFGEILVKNT